ncbi:hypothetical protein DB347_17840 [Opitutaceae bacterium EW11]|nr:hypothetical protein DB347_17840 [Opitutaceae bacterium EW11]
MPRIVQIERPDLTGISPTFELASLEKLSQEKLRQLERRLEEKEENSTLPVHAKVEYLLRGSRVVVDAGVSRDMELSVATGATLQTLPRLARCMLFTWVDKTLPELLLIIDESKGHVGVFGSVDSTERLPDGSLASLYFHFSESDFAEFMARDVVSEGPGPSELVVSLSKAEGEAVRYLMRIALKTLAYSAIPQHKPALLSTRAEIKAAGIHPKHATRPAYRVRYLPRIIRPTAAADEPKVSDPKEFLGRAGHLRYYSDERYTHMRGQWQWIPPIEPPDGVKVVYKVRKVR